MKILVFGAGAIGSVFGGFLSETQHEVTLLGRPWHIDKIRRDGLIISGIWGRHRFTRFNLWTNLKKQIFDIILITVKSYDTQDVVKAEKIKMVPKIAKGYKKVFFKKLVPLTYNHHPSMLQDINRNRPTEIDFLNGKISYLAKKYKIQTPYNDILTKIIKAKEKT